MRFLQFLTLLSAVLVFAACGTGGVPTTRPTPSPAPPTSVATPTAVPVAVTPTSAPPVATSAAGCLPMTMGRAVDVEDFRFDPASITISVGETITWANVGGTTHTVTFDGGPDCGRIASGEGVSRVFDTAGTFDYICTIHPSMTGTVVVQ